MYKLPNTAPNTIKFFKLVDDHVAYEHGPGCQGDDYITLLYWISKFVDDDVYTIKFATVEKYSTINKLLKLE